MGVTPKQAAVALVLAGCGLVALGVAFIYPPAGIIAAGLSMVALGLFGVRVE